MKPNPAISIEVWKALRALRPETQDDPSNDPPRGREPSAGAGGGDGGASPRYPKHIICDKDGLFSADLDGWGRTIVADALKLEETLGWSWNLHAPARFRLAIQREDTLPCNEPLSREGKQLVPDFLFLTRLDGGEIAIDLVDLHGLREPDPLPCLRALARQAEARPHALRRMEAFVEIGGRVWVLDLMDAETRRQVMAAASASDLVGSP